MSFTVWKSLSPFISAQNMRSKSLKPSPLSSCRIWLAAEPFNRTSRTWICFSSILLRTTFTIWRGCISRVGKFPRPWIGMVSVRMASSRCTCSQLRTLMLLPCVSDIQLTVELLSSSDMMKVLDERNHLDMNSLLKDGDKPGLAPLRTVSIVWVTMISSE